jgi:hypothetical protein
MIFVIVYDRQRSKAVSKKRFRDNERALAQRERLALELKARGAKRDIEVVLLEAGSEQQLRKSHSRYFLSTEQFKHSLESDLLKEPAV